MALNPPAKPDDSRPRLDSQPHFSLVEMLAAVTVLMILMAILFGFISKAQQLWSTDSANSEIYANARLFFDIVTRDLQGIVVSNIENQTIQYGPGRHGGNVDTSTGFPATGDFRENQWIMAFVTRSGIGTTSSDNSRLVEVGYILEDDSTVIRQMTTSRAMNNSRWDFFGNPLSTWAANWSWSDKTTVLAEGVKDVEIRMYTDPTTPVLSVADTPLSHVVVTAEFFDKHMLNATNTKIEQGVRKFSKVIYISDGGSDQ